MVNRGQAIKMEKLHKTENKPTLQEAILEGFEGVKNTRRGG
jgi:hypothetical protein